METIKAFLFNKGSSAEMTLVRNQRAAPKCLGSMAGLSLTQSAFQSNCTPCALCGWGEDGPWHFWLQVAVWKRSEKRSASITQNNSGFNSVKHMAELGSSLPDMRGIKNLKVVQDAHRTNLSSDRVNLAATPLAGSSLSSCCHCAQEMIWE